MPSLVAPGHPSQEALPSLTDAALTARMDGNTRPVLDDWLRQPDLDDRLVHFDEALREHLEPQLTHHTPSLKSIKSTSSMAPTRIHQKRTTSRSPSIRDDDGETEATESEISISTGLASHFSGVPLLEETHGVLEISRAQVRPPLFECAFWFLNCGYVSQNKDEWKIHCESHFRGEEPPQSAQCPLCDWTYSSTSNGWVAWDQRMEHLAFQHNMRGQTLRTSRPDFELFRYLWNRRLIDYGDFKELTSGNYFLSRPPTETPVTDTRSRRIALRRGVSGREDMHREATPDRDVYTRLATSPGEEIVHSTLTGPSDSGLRTTVRSGPQHDLEQSSAEPPGVSRDHYARAAIDPTEQHMAASVEGRDSGYGTMSNTGPNRSNREDDAGSVRTMLSDASHVFQPPKAREDLISAFVDDLREELGLGTMDVAGRTRIIAQLSGLLKVFSLKLGNAVLSQEEQDAKNFIRQQRE
jgi:hypothetical protein